MILDTVAEPHFIKCVDLWGGQGVVVAAGQAMGRISFVIFGRFLRRTSQSRHAFDVLSTFFQFSNSFVCSENGDGCGLLAERELLPRTSRPYHQPQLTSLPAQVKTNYISATLYPKLHCRVILLTSDVCDPLRGNGANHNGKSRSWSPRSSIR